MGLKNSAPVYCLIALNLLGLSSLHAQESPDLPASFFEGRREALRALMPPHSVCVLFSAPGVDYSSDMRTPYLQNPDLYYFSGFREQDAMMLIFKEPQHFTGSNRALKEVLFMQPSNASMEKWTGRRMTLEEAMDGLHIDTAIDAFRFRIFPINFASYRNILLDLPPENVQASGYNRADLYNLLLQFRARAGIYRSLTRRDLLLSNLMVDRNSPSQKKLIDTLLNEHINYILFDRLTSQLREVKTREELSMLGRSIEITCSGQNEAIRSFTPSSSEREIQGILEYMAKKGGAETMAFPTLVASGNNGCILFYNGNKASHVGNQLVIMESGAEYEGYASKVTRTVPASGTFTKEQLEIYNIVLAARDSSIAAVHAGIPFEKLEETGRRVIANGLVKLGIIGNPEEVPQYFPHGVASSIGMNVHDKYLLGASLQKNMVITIGPGIYITEGSPCNKKWWGIAVRIVDDVLVLEDHGEILSSSVPVLPSGIESLMKQNSIFKNRQSIDLPTRSGKK